MEKVRDPRTKRAAWKEGRALRYYVSQAVLQNRKDQASGISRVAAPDIEELVIAALRHQVGDINPQVVSSQTSPPLELSDRDLVALKVERIVLRSRHIDLTLRGGVSPEGQGPVDAIPKGAKDVSAAKTFVNALADPVYQQPFLTESGSLPTNPAVQMPADLAKALGGSEEEIMAHNIAADWAIVAAQLEARTRKVEEIINKSK